MEENTLHDGQIQVIDAITTAQMKEAQKIMDFVKEQVDEAVGKERHRILNLILAKYDGNVSKDLIRAIETGLTEQEAFEW